MKRILILTILLMSSLAWAGSTTVVVGQGGGAPTCLTDNFTSLAQDGALETYNSNYKSISETIKVTNLEGGAGGGLVRVEAAYTVAGCYYDDGSGAKSGTTYTTATVDDGGTNYMPYPITRASADNMGYAARLSHPSGGNWTRIYVMKNGAELGWTACTITQSTAHTIYLKARDSGANVVVEIWVDDNTGDPDATKTDTSDVISSGYAGFYYPGTDNVVWTVDDFSDCAF